MRPKFILRFVIITVLTVTLVLIGLNYSKVDTEKLSRSIKEPKYTTNRWDRNIGLNNRGPYGLYWLEQLLVEYPKFEEFNLIQDADLLDSISKVDNSLFFYVGEDMVLTDDEIHSLLYSVEQGNEWMIVTHRSSAYLLNILANYPRITFHFQAVAPIVFEKDTFELNYIDNLDTLPAKWAVLHPSLIPDADILAHLNGNATLVRFSYGKGSVYLDLNTKSYLNYQLKQKDGLAHLMEVINHYEGNKIQWLAFADEPDNYYPEEDGDDQNSYLAIVLTFEAFRWALILILILVVSYLLLHAKRRAPIATIENIPEKGASFASTIAGFYYKNDQPYYMLSLMRKNLTSNIAHYFYIDISKDIDDKVLKQLAAKSNYPLKDLKELIKLSNRKSMIDYPFLEKLNNKIRDFYWKSGIWNEQKKALQAQQWQTFYLQKPFTWITVLIAILSMSAGLFPDVENERYFSYLQIGGGLISLVYSVVLLFFIYNTPLRTVLAVGLSVTVFFISLISIFSIRFTLNDIGTLQLLIGFSLLLFGLYKFAVPEVSFTAQQLKIFRIFRKEKVIDRTEILAVNLANKRISIRTKSEIHNITLQTLSFEEREQLIQLLYKSYQNLKDGERNK